MNEREVALYIKAEEENAMRHILKAHREGRVIILPKAPQGLMLLDDANYVDSDVYCPNCEHTLSGIDSEWDDDFAVLLQCPHCGTYLDSSRTVNKTDVVREKIENRKKSICRDIGEVYDVHGCCFEEDGKLCINTGRSVYRYSTPDDLLRAWYRTMKKDGVRKEGEWWHDWSEDLAFIEEHVLLKEGA